MSEQEEKLLNLIQQYKAATGIISVVEDYTGVSINQPTRKRPVCDARQIAMYLIKQNTGLTLMQTARLCGLGTHAAAWHACRQVPLYLETDRAYREKYGDLINFN
jgi:chromosomal replication initiation ATPase DnaA